VATWVRIRNDDPRPKPYTPKAAVPRAATILASDVAGLATTIAVRYDIEVPDDGAEVRLRRRT
jgi:hypothetical protein